MSKYSTETGKLRAAVVLLGGLLASPPNICRSAEAQPGADQAIPPPYRDAVELPAPFPQASEEMGREHLIVADGNPGHREDMEALQARLLALGVARERIHLLQVSSLAEFRRFVSGVRGEKKIYFFGHGEPFTLLFDQGEYLDLREHPSFAREHRVAAIAHYGCSFVGFNPEQAAALQRRLGTSVTLYGHRHNTPGNYNSPWSPDHPMLRVDLSPSRVSMHLPRDALLGRVAAIGTLLGAPSAGLVPAAAQAGAQIHAVDTVGRDDFVSGVEEGDIQAVATATLGNLATPMGGLPAVGAAFGTQAALEESRRIPPGATVIRGPRTLVEVP